MMPDVHALVGAFALNAVDPGERLAFEAHLADCESCMAEAGALRTTAAALAVGVATAPPAHLRRRVLLAAEGTPQLPPSVPQLRSAAPAAAGAPRRRRTAAWLAAAAVVVAIGGVAVERSRDDPPSAVTASAVFGSSDAKVRTVALPGGQVRIAVSSDLGLMAVDGSDLPPPEADRVYQLWVVDDAGAHSAGFLDEPEVAMGIPEDGEVTVTSEPLGGSEQPTGEPLLAVDPGNL
jgi:hypothetical protein